MTRMEKCEAVIAKINREMGNVGKIDIAQVALILAGRAQNESHPITARIRSELKKHGLNPTIQSGTVAR